MPPPFPRPEKLGDFFDLPALSFPLKTPSAAFGGTVSPAGPSGHRPGPTEAAAETGAGRSPPESCALMEGGFPPRKGGFPRGPTAPLGKNKIPPPVAARSHPVQTITTGGGERAPVALCREPTEAAAETGVGTAREVTPPDPAPPAPPKGEASPAFNKHKIKQRIRAKYALGGARGGLVPTGHLRPHRGRQVRPFRSTKKGT